MDREVHGGNSSSPNADILTVTSIRRRGAEEGIYRISFSDGSSFFIPERILLEFSLSKGKELSREEYSSLKLESEKVEAFEKSVDLLSRREHSSEELRIKLKKRDYSDAAVRAAIEETTARGYLSNRRFAEEWVGARLRRHPEGRTNLFAGLLQRGVGREDAEAAISAIVTEEDLQDAAVRAAQKYARKAQNDQRKLEKRLYSLGFSRNEVKFALNRQKNEKNLQEM